MSETYLSNAPEETTELGELFVNRYLINSLENRKSILVVLQGDLGNGKTQFAKGVARALGIREPISSPSYAYVNEYDLNFGVKDTQLIHIDAWRVDSIEIEDLLKLNEHVKPGNVILVEWHENLSNKLKADLVFHVRFKYINEVSREITVSQVKQ